MTRNELNRHNQPTDSTSRETNRSTEKSSNQQKDQLTLSASLLQISKGTGIAFFGLFVGLFFAFIGRVLVARIGTEVQYGVFSLAFVVLNICAVIGTLGLQQGATRSIAFARGKNDSEKVQNLVSVSVQLGLLTSIMLSILIFFTSDIIATRIFHEPTLVFPLKVFSFGIPFFTLLNVLTSIFRGFGNVKPKVYFQDILRNATFTMLLLPFLLFNLSFDGIFYAFLASIVVSFVALIMYTAKKLPSPVRIFNNLRTNPVVKELLCFSLPLLGVAMLQMIISWTDTLMLGGLKGSRDVGLYNTAHPLAHFISFPLGALLLIYTPITSNLYARKLIDEMRRNFAVLTKWLCLATFPLFLILFLYPEPILHFLFGVDYTPATNVLRILSLGFIINNLLGPNGATLISMGKSQFMMWTTLATAVLNVGLNAAFIPSFGIEGAATASITALISINLIRCRKLYSLTDALPVSKNLVKPILVLLVLAFLTQFIFRNFVNLDWWMLPFIFILYYSILGFALLFTRSFDQEDITMLLAIEKRANLNLSFAKRILRRFL